MRFLIAGLVLLGALAVTAPRAEVLPDGTYRYEMSVAGRAAGTSTIVVRREGGTIVIGESASVAGIGLLSERKIEESTYATQSYVVDAAGKHAIVTILGNEATLTHDKVTVKITAAADAPFVVSDNLVAAWAQIPATLHATGEKQLTLACACGGFMAVPISVTGREKGTVSFKGADGVAVTLTFDPQTYVLTRLDVPAQQASVVLQSQDARVIPLPSPVVPTPMPLPPARYTSRDVSIRAGDGVVLAGTLTMPGAAAHATPAFVFVHGSGCIDRDETIGPNKVFAQLANDLSNGGYAVLRYDKRSCGKSGGTFATRDRLIADARDVIAYLRAQPGIDPARIFVLGHSEGGELAPSIAIADGKLAGVVLLAPPALPLDKILMQQVLRNVTASQRAAVAQQEQTQLDAVAAGKKSGASATWLRSSFGIDPAALITKVPSPILIVQGEKDIQVLAADTPRLVSAAQAAHRKLSVVMLPGDDHLFIKLPAGEDSTGVEYFTPAYLDPALFAAIEGWLRGLP
ncbi:MAG TPA: alpha/beta fold hydrolase [Candidatus Nitrosotalea sp.]|nr:alpha/beta fold hydrolase [Candidatus Nitrosotalea sp.]